MIATGIVRHPLTSQPVKTSPKVKAYRLDTFALHPTIVTANTSGVVTFSDLVDGLDYAAYADFGGGLTANVPLTPSPIFTADLADGAVTTAKIADGAITTAKLSNGLARTAYTPVLAGSSTAGANTYTADGQVGWYSRMNDMVFVRFRVRLSAKDVAMAGSVYITLPVAGGTYTNPDASAAIGYYYLDLNAGYTQVGSYMKSGEARVYLQQMGDNVGALDVAAANVLAGTYVGGTIWYYV